MTDVGDAGALDALTALPQRKLTTRSPRSSLYAVVSATPEVFVCVVACAWTAAVVAQLTGYAVVFHHDWLIEGSLPLVVVLAMFLAGWQLMIATMMLPSMLPMLGLYSSAVARHNRPVESQAAFIGGYVAVWTAFGALAFVGDAGVHRVVDNTPMISAHTEWITAVLLVIVGCAQFLPLTESCLRSCRHPIGYLMQHYRPGVRAAFQLGRSHGFYCLGCCWALMLVMFAAGVANLFWMAALTAAMVYAKVGRRGEGLLHLTGIAFVLWGCVIAAHPNWLPSAMAGVR